MQVEIPIKAMTCQIAQGLLPRVDRPSIRSNLESMRTSYTIGVLDEPDLLQVEPLRFISQLRGMWIVT